MAIHGKRYALDQDNSLQYEINFVQNVPVSCTAVGRNKEDTDAFVEKGRNGNQGTFIAYDDDLFEGKNANGETEYRRPVYQMTYEMRNGAIDIISYEIAALDADAPLPPQHGSDQADLIRDFVEEEEIKDALNSRPRQPNFTFNKNSQTKPGNLQPGERRSARFQISDAKLEKSLKDWCTDLTDRAQKGHLDPVIGRDHERQDLRQMLLRKKRASVMLLGEAGVGKSAMAEALAQDIANGEAEAELGNARIVSLDLQGMNAGSQFRGAFEERLKPILQGLEERGGYLRGQKIILFIDEIHSALTAGQASGGTNAGEIMKPYLASEGFTCIGATTPEEYKKHIEPNKALVRRFQPYTLEAPGVEDTKKILQGLSETYAKHHRMSEDFDDKMLDYIIKMTNHFMPTKHQPDKSISIMDDAAATARHDGRSVVEQDDIIAALSRATGLKKEFLNQSDFDRYQKLGDELSETVVGQPGVHKIAQELKASRLGLTRDQGPRGSFILPGPTGVGKTEFAKALAKALTGSEDNLIRIDMGDFGQSHSSAGLTGAPPGFVGHDNDSAGQLTEGVRNKPFSVLLLDEVEKAHKDVFHSLLSILDDGKLKDKKGREVDYTNTIILMTTNLGAREVQAFLSGEDTIGFTNIEGQNKEERDREADNARITAIMGKALKSHFAPEFLNRVDAVVPFYDLQKSAITSILELELKKVEKSLQQSTRGLQLHNISLQLSQNVKETLADAGYDRVYGARAMRRAIKENLTNQLAEWMMDNKDDLVARNAKGKFQLTINELGEKFKPSLKQLKQTKAAKPKVS